MIYGIHVYAWTRESHKSWTVSIWPFVISPIYHHPQVGALSSLWEHVLYLLEYFCVIFALFLHYFFVISALFLWYCCVISTLFLRYFCVISVVLLHNFCIISALFWYFDTKFGNKTKQKWSSAVYSKAATLLFLVVCNCVGVLMCYCYCVIVLMFVSALWQYCQYYWGTVIVFFCVL